MSIEHYSLLQGLRFAESLRHASKPEISGKIIGLIVIRELCLGEMSQVAEMLLAHIPSEDKR